MIGVTIGINPIYKTLAKLSANCVEEMMGLEVIILSKKELMNSRLTHPAALKLMIFDLVKDENVLYFDADWLCVKHWNPFEFNNSSFLVACNDFVLNSDWPNQYMDKDILQYDIRPYNSLPSSIIKEIRKDYVNEIQQFTAIKTNCLNWINTGLWIANKNSHYEWLKMSLDLYEGKIGHHSEYYEQPAMNKAIERLGIDIHYLNRIHNTLIASRSKWPRSLIGLHVKLKHHHEFVAQVISKKIKSVEDVRNYFLI